MVREIKEVKEVKEFSNLPKFSNLLKLFNLSPLATLHNPYTALQTHVHHAHRPYQRI